MDQSILELLRSGGAYPTGACSAWPKERNALVQEEAARLRAERGLPPIGERIEYAEKVKPSLGQLAKNLAKTAGYAAVGGKVLREVRDERYAVCQACPHFIPNSKRCSECGCFMEAKTWINGPKNQLCPKDKWER